MDNLTPHRTLGSSGYIAAGDTAKPKSKERHLVIAPKLSLVSSVYGFLLLFTFSFLSILTISVSSRSDLVFSGALIDAASVRTEVAAKDLSHLLDTEWAQLKFLSELIERGASTESVEDAMAGMVVGNSSTAWTALVTPVGDVVLSRNMPTVDAEFSEAKWLSSGLTRSDIRVESGIEGFTGPSVVMAQPVLQDGRPVGTVVTALPLADILVSITELAKTLGTDLLLTDATDRVVLSTIPGVDSETKIVVSGADQLDGAPAQKQIWPDGKIYYLSRPVAVAAQNAPSMGWKITGRLESTSFSLALSEVLRFALVVGGALSLVLAIGAVIFVNVFIKPISRLADAAVELAEGHEGYPPELRSSAESARLSAALAKLQSARSRSHF